MPIIDIGVNISSLKKSVQQAKAAIDTLGNAADKTGGTLSRMGSDGKSAGDAISAAMSSAAKNVLALVGAYKSLEGISSFVKRGIEFNSSLEQSKIGIASIITSMVGLEDAQGRVLEGAEKYQAAQGLAADMMKEIQRLGLETTANTTDLVAGVQAILAPAKQAGMALKDIPKFAVAGAQAMQTLGVPLNQMRTELSALLTGRVNKTQDILAPKLFADVTEDLGEYIRKLKETGQLIPELQKRLEPFAQAGKDVAQTFEGLSSNLSEAFDVIAGQAGDGLVKNLKKAIQTLQDFFMSSEEGSVGLGENFQNIAGAIGEIENALGESILSAVETLVDGLKWINDAIGPEPAENIRAIGDAAKIAGAALAGIFVVQKIQTFTQSIQNYKQSLVDAARETKNAAYEEERRIATVRNEILEEQKLAVQNLKTIQNSQKSAANAKLEKAAREELRNVTIRLTVAERELAAAKQKTDASFNNLRKLKSGITTMAAFGARLVTMGRSILGFFGGPIGVAITAVTTAMGYLASKQSNAEKAAEQHSKALETLKTIMDKIKGSSDGTSKALTDLEMSQAKATENVLKQSVKRQTKALEEAIRDAAGELYKINTYSEAPGVEIIRDEDVAKITDRLYAISTAFKDGKVDAEQYQKELNDLATKLHDMGLEDIANTILNIANAEESSVNALKNTKSDLDEVTKALQENAQARNAVREVMEKHTQEQQDYKDIMAALSKLDGEDIENKGKLIEKYIGLTSNTESAKEALKQQQLAQIAAIRKDLEKTRSMAEEEVQAWELVAAFEALSNAEGKATDATQKKLADARQSLEKATKWQQEMNKRLDEYTNNLNSKGSKGKSGGGTSQVDNAKESIARLREEIAQLNGNMAASESTLNKKIADIEKMGKAAKLSKEEIAQLKQEYTEAFQTNALNKFNRELLELEGNTRAVAEIDMAEKLKQAQQQIDQLGLSTEKAAEMMERYKIALENQQNYKDLQTVAGFYKELASLTGNYNLGLEQQNELIQKQAQVYKEAQIPQHLIDIWIQLQKLEQATDPFSGLIRGALKFGAEYGNMAKQMESLTMQLGSTMSNTLTTAFRTGKFEAEDFFNSLLDMATQAMSNILIGQLFSGIGGLFSGGGSSIGAAKNSFFGFAHGGVFSNGISGYSNSVVSSPTLFNYGAAGHVTAFARGAGLMGEAGPEAIMPLVRTGSGDLGVRAVNGGEGSARSIDFEPNIAVNVINQSGQNVNAETITSSDGKGNFSIDVLLTQVEQGLVARAKQGRSSLMKYQESTYGIGRANIIQQTKGRA